jgi:hypothetical protein
MCDHLRMGIEGMSRLLPAVADPAEGFLICHCRIDAPQVGGHGAGVVLDVADIVDVQFAAGEFAKSGMALQRLACLGGE